MQIYTVNRRIGENERKRNVAQFGRQNRWTYSEFNPCLQCVKFISVFVTAYIRLFWVTYVTCKSLEALAITLYYNKSVFSCTRLYVRVTNESRGFPQLDWVWLIDSVSPTQMRARRVKYHE